MIAQAPALFESLTGQKLSDLMSRVPALAELVPPESQNGAGQWDAAPCRDQRAGRAAAQRH